jgi:hypothetical protein
MPVPTLELLGSNANLPEATRLQLAAIANSVWPHAALPEVASFYEAARSGSQPRLFDALRALQGSTRAELVAARESFRTGALGTGDPFDQVTMYMERGVQRAAEGVSTVAGAIPGLNDTQAAQWTASTAQNAVTAYNDYIPPALRLPVFGALVGGSAYLLSKPMEWLGFKRAANWSRTVGKAAWNASKWAAIFKTGTDLLNRGIKGGIMNLTPPALRNRLPNWLTH